MSISDAGNQILSHFQKFSGQTQIGSRLIPQLISKRIRNILYNATETGVHDQEEQHISKDVALVKKEKDEDGKTTETAILVSEDEDHKAIGSAPTDITKKVAKNGYAHSAVAFPEKLNLPSEPPEN